MIKRFILMLTVAAFVVAALSVTSPMAFAANDVDCPPSYDAQGQHCRKQAGPNEFRVQHGGDADKECVKRHPGNKENCPA